MAGGACMGPEMGPGIKRRPGGLILYCAWRRVINQ